MNRLFGQIKQRFSLRKCSFGVASILIGISFLGVSPVSAEESVLARSHEVATVNVTEATAQPVLGTVASLVVEATEQERSESALAPVEEMGGDAGLVNSRPLAEEELFLANTDDEDKALGTSTLTDEEPLMTSTDGEKGSEDKTISTRSLSAEASLLTNTASDADTGQSESVKQSGEAIKQLEQALKKEAASKVTDHWRANRLETIAQEIKRQEELGAEHYVVQWGDTLSTIAAASQQELQVITALNKITHPDVILTGQTLTGVLRPNATSQATLFELERRRALAGTSTAWAPRTVETIQKEIKRQEELGLEDYLIQWGDTLSALSVASEQPLDNLVALNQISNQELILTGSLLKGILPPKTLVANPKRVVSGYLYDATNKLLEEEQVGLYLNDELVAELTTDYMGYVYTHLDIDKSYELKADHLAIKLSVNKESHPTVLATEGRLELGRTFADEGEDDKFQLNSHVIYVDDSKYTTESNDGRQAILSKEITAQPGDILVIPPSKIYETSAAIKVIEIVNKDGQAHITYEEPNFFDVFTEFTLKNEKIDLADAVFIPADGVKVVSEKRSDDGVLLRSIEIDEGELVFKDFIKKLDKSELTISMKGEVSPNIDFNIIEGLKEFSIDGKFEPEVTFAVANSEFEPDDKESNLWKRKKRLDENLDELGDELYVTLGEFYIPIPVSLGSVGFQLSLLARLSAEGEWSLGFGGGLEIPFTWSSKNPSVKPKDEELKFNIDFIKAALEGEVGVGPVLKGGLTALATEIASLETYSSFALAGEVATGVSLDSDILKGLQTEKDPEKLKEIAQKILRLGGKLEGKLKAGVDLVFDLIENLNGWLEEKSKDKIIGLELPEKLSLLSKEWTMFKFGFGTSEESTDNPDINLATLLPNPFSFSAGSGGWWTSLQLLNNNEFEGSFIDNDLGVTGPAHPNGSRSISNFKGRFRNVEKLNDFEYRFELADLEYPEVGTISYQNGVEITTVHPYGVHGGKEFRLYLPGRTTKDLSDNLLGWGHNYGGIVDEAGNLSKTILVNVEKQLAFVYREDDVFVRYLLQKHSNLYPLQNFPKNIVLPWETDRQSSQLEAYDMSDFVDFYNAHRPEVYEIADVVKDLRAIELPQSLGSLSKDELATLSETYKSGWLYFSGDRKIVEVVAGGRGGAFPEIIIPPYSEWKKVDDGYEIITSLNMTDVKPYEKVTVKRNRKSYSGGEQRSLFYIDDIEILDKEFRLNRLHALAKEVYLQNQGSNTFRPQDLIVLADDINGTIQIRENTPGSPIRHLVATYRLNANKQFEVLNVVKGTWSLVSPRKILV